MIILEGILKLRCMYIIMCTVFSIFFSAAYCTAIDSGRIRKGKRFLLWKITRY